MATYTTKERWEKTGEYARSQNEPYKEAICVNNAGYGDDNDYSCFLGGVVRELFKTMRYEMAWRLYLTDPMVMEYIEYEQFKEMMAEQVKRWDAVEADEW